MLHSLLSPMRATANLRHEVRASPDHPTQHEGAIAVREEGRPFVPEFAQHASNRLYETRTENQSLTCVDTWTMAGLTHP